MMRIRLVLFFYLFTAFQAFAQQSPFTLQIEGNRSEGGTLFIAIYDKSAQNWRATPSQHIQWTLSAEENQAIPLALTPGTYAIRAFVDTNNNGLLDLSDKDRPLEPFGSSIGTDRHSPSLQFRRSTFVLNHKSPQAVIRLRYPKATKSEASPPTPSAPQPPDASH